MLHFFATGYLRGAERRGLRLIFQQHWREGNSEDQGRPAIGVAGQRTLGRARACPGSTPKQKKALPGGRAVLREHGNYYY